MELEKDVKDVDKSRDDLKARHGSVKEITIRRDETPECFLHQLPHGDVRPVYLTDKQQKGNVKSFISLSEEELKEYHELNETLLTLILSRFHLNILHANHLVYQPIAAIYACNITKTPLIIFPHGIAIFPSVIPEAYPLVLMESLSNGVLPVVSYFSGFKDGVDELRPFLGESLTEKTKIPVDPQIRINKIASNIIGLLSEQGLKSISPKLRQAAMENYDWSLRASQMVSAYGSFIEDGNQGTGPR